MTKTRATTLAWSPDGCWIASNELLWDWSTTNQRAWPISAWKVRFSRDSHFVLLNWEGKAAVCSVESPEQFLYPPVPCPSGDRSDFIGDGHTYVVGQSSGGFQIRETSI